MRRQALRKNQQKIISEEASVKRIRAVAPIRDHGMQLVACFYPLVFIHFRLLERCASPYGQLCQVLSQSCHFLFDALRPNSSL